MTLAADLAQFAATAQPGAAARRIMHLSIYDWMACGIAGADEPVAGIIRGQSSGEGGARIFGGGSRAPRDAALINGTISHALDYDDTHFAHIGHPSVAVFPAVFALGAPAPDLVDAALIGAEVSVRIGLWLGRAHYQVGFHQTATAGAFGAVLAAARVQGLAPDRTAQALGLAATMASGLKAQFGTMGKPLNAGLAAETGVRAVQMADAGFASNPDALLVFGETHHGEGASDAFDGLGRIWLMERVSHKLHACCHGLHAMLEALGQTSVIPGQIEQVTVATHPRWLTVCNQPDPTTGLGAKFSFRMAAAMALAGLDTSAIGTFSDANATRPDLVALRDKVTVKVDDDLSETASRVSVLAEGRVQDAVFDLSAPIAYDALADRLRAKGRALLGEALERRLWRAAVEQPDTNAILALMGARPAP